MAVQFAPCRFRFIFTLNCACSQDGIIFWQAITQKPLPFGSAKILQGATLKTTRFSFGSVTEKGLNTCSWYASPFDTLRKAVFRDMPPATLNIKPRRAYFRFHAAIAACMYFLVPNSPWCLLIKLLALTHFHIKFLLAISYLSLSEASSGIGSDPFFQRLSNSSAFSSPYSFLTSCGAKLSTIFV